jgi:hypothetical protein
MNERRLAKDPDTWFLSQKVVAEFFGVSIVRIQQLERRALHKLRTALEAEFGPDAGELATAVQSARDVVRKVSDRRRRGRKLKKV